MGRHRKPNAPPIVLRQMAKPVVEAAASVCGLTYDYIMQRRRTPEVAEARFIAMLVLHRRGWSYPSIAIATGRTDHTTCIHGIDRALSLEAVDPGFAAAVSVASAKSGGEA